MNWGTGSVYTETIAACTNQGLTVTELPELSDVDRPEELNSLRSDERFADVFTGQPRLSVIVPALNEADVLAATLERVRGAEGIEIIVVDGGSRDSTSELAALAGATVLQVAGGRAAQQNAGAAAANGRYLLFLHADTVLPDGYADMIRMALDTPSTVAGAFRFRTDDSRTLVRLVEWGTNIRSAILQLPYGDQGLFMAKRVFLELGGFAALPIMEDFDFVRRLRRRGNIVTLPEAVITSARRWQQLGVLRTTLRNQVMIAGFFAGVSPERLAHLYRGSTKAQGQHTEGGTIERKTT
jgi:rSAM/selenodomain-associated transferase 2